MIRFLLLLALALLTSADVGQSMIEGRLLLPPKALKKGVRVVVDGKHDTYARQNGTFLIWLEPGIHVVDFAVRGFSVPQIRVDVSRKTQGKYRAFFNDAHRSAVPDPIEIEPISALNYFEVHDGDWTQMFRSPMVLMMLALGGIAFVMPMLVDTEELQRASKEMQAQGGLAAGLSGLQAAAERAAQPPQQQQVKPRPGSRPKAGKR